MTLAFISGPGPWLALVASRRRAADGRLKLFAPNREPTFREGAYWSVGWLTVALAVAPLVWVLFSADDAVTYTTIFFERARRRQSWVTRDVNDEYMYINMADEVAAPWLIARPAETEAHVRSSAPRPRRDAGAGRRRRHCCRRAGCCASAPPACSAPTRPFPPGPPTSPPYRMTRFASGTPNST